MSSIQSKYYPVVVPGTSNGLVSSSGLLGNESFTAQSGSAVSSGYVGQVIVKQNSGATLAALTSNTATAVISISSGDGLTAGVWEFWGVFAFGGGANTTATSCTNRVTCLSTTNASTSGDSGSAFFNLGQDTSTVNPTNGSDWERAGPYIYTVGTSVPTMYLNALAVFTGGNMYITAAGMLAKRIA